MERRIELTPKGRLLFDSLELALKIYELAEEEGCTIEELYSRLETKKRTN